MSKKITEEDLKKHPEWAEQGLKVGDDKPKQSNRETDSDEEEEEDGEGGGGNHPGKPGNP